MESEKTACQRCETVILQVTANLTEGVCMPCARALERAGEPVSDHVSRYFHKRDPDPVLDHIHPEPDVMVSVRYFPGRWRYNHTGWTIQISTEGTLWQAVEWDLERQGNRRNSSEEELLEPVQLESSALASIQSMIDCCPTNGAETLESFVNSDGDESVSLILPLKKVSVEMPNRMASNDLAEDDRGDLLACSCQIWEFADKHASYSCQDHDQSLSRLERARKRRDSSHLTVRDFRSV